MLIVGTDRMTVVGTAGRPDGTRHAVDPDGRVLCRSARARFTWPALTWDDHRPDEDACTLCTQVRMAQEAVSHLPAYPTEAPVVSAVLMPWQPLPGLFEASGQ
jgi:hypothetical protein